MNKSRVAACAVAVIAATTAWVVGGTSPSRSVADPLSAEPATEVLGTQVARTDEVPDGVVVDRVDAAAAAAPASAAPASDSAVIAPPPDAFAVVPGAAIRHPRASPRRALPEGRAGTWALIVGVNDYPGDGHDLRFAVNDADDVAAALEGVGVAGDRRLVLRDAQATAAAIELGLDWLVDHAGPDAVAVVSFAGHARERGGRQSFVAADGVELSDRDLADRLSRLRARATWLNFATCFAGGFDELLAQGRTLVAAAPAGQLAYENTSIGRSYLGEYMVRKALRTSPDGDVRAAFASARDAIRRDYPDRVPVEVAASPDLVVRLRPPTTPAAVEEPSEPAPAPTPAPNPPAKPDSCATVTLGVVRCD